MSEARTVLLSVVLGAVAGFAGGFFARQPDAATEPAAPSAKSNDAAVAAELARLAKAIERLEARVADRRDRTDVNPAGAPVAPVPAPAQPSPGSPGEPSLTSYASWTDEEVYVVAQAKGDDVSLFKEALRRKLPDEKRAKLLVALSAHYYRLDPQSQANLDTLVEALQFAPTSTAFGADAALRLAYSLSNIPSERWRGRAYYESVLRDAPSEEHRMKAAYGLAWRHDLGDNSPKEALEAFRKYLQDWGEKWKDTPEAQWARHRVQVLEKQ